MGYNELEEDFFLAIYHGDVAVVEAMLQSGISPDVTNRLHGESAFLYAASQGQDACVEALLRHGATHEPLPMIEAAVTDDPAVMERFLRMGGDPNFTDASGQTPLSEATGWGNQRVIAVLRAAGAREGN